MAKTLPVIDLSSSREDGSGLAQAAEKIGAACRDVGFFYVINHGVDSALMAAAFVQSRRFFALPLEDKKSVASDRIGGNRGYFGLMGEALDPARGPDRKEAFNVGFDLAPDDAELLAGRPFRSLNAWPGLSRIQGDAARLLRRLRCSRSASASRLRPRPRPQARLFRRQVHASDGDAAPPALSAGIG